MRPDSASNKEAKLGSIAAAWALGVALCYVGFFWVEQQRPFGGPESWGAFGDYFGGLVNPLVGIVTVLLVVRTLQTTRMEAADTREQLRAQLDHMVLEREDAKRSHVLAELRHRLEGALSEWNRLMSLPVTGVSLWRPMQLSLEHVTTWGTIGDHLSNSDFAFRVAETIASPGRNGAKANWLETFHPAEQLASEIASYASEYEEAAGDNFVADFYRKRLQKAAEILHRMELLTEKIL